MRRQQPVLGTIFGASDRDVEQAVCVKVFWIDLSAGDWRKDFELVSRQPAVVSVARETTTDDAPVLHLPQQSWLKGLDQFLLLRHLLYPRIRLYRHRSSEGQFSRSSFADLKI